MSVKPGLLVAAILAIVLLAFAVSVDFPKANGGGFKGDESTYYVLAHSLARDFDFQYERKDLVRVWEEFPGPQGIFLKRGKSIRVRGSGEFPYFRWIKREDPARETRLFFSKSYIYPLFAAPFVYVFGTNGFLVFHAILLAFDFLAIYLFAAALTRSNWVALPVAAAFLGLSVVPVYLVWLTPELFNVSLAFYAVFLWAYKEVAAERPQAPSAGLRSPFLLGPSSDYAAAVLIGINTFSKPPHVLLLAPMVALAVTRFQWKRAAGVTLMCGAVTAALFAINAGLTGEFNYQGGDRKTFYHYTGFPFANTWETFDNIGPVRGREDLLVGDVLVNAHSDTVFGHNLWYFVAGRNAGLVPYFFPGIVALAAFALSRRKTAWQWFVLATLVVVVVAHVFVWPFTWNGGGGPVGSRYFLPFYSLFLLLLPPTTGVGAALISVIGGALFTAQLVLNPFYVSTHPGEHAKSGLLRVLPLELTLLHDLPVAQNREKMRQPLGGTPRVFGYFPDDGSYNPEGEWFWVKGNSTAEVVLRAPVDHAGGTKWISKRITRITVEVRNGGKPNQVNVSTGRETQTVELNPGEMKKVSLSVRSGVPFRRDVQPPSYLYPMWVSASAGFVPFLDIPCEKPGTCASDSRFLGAMIHVIPEYTDADVSTWTPPDGKLPGKDSAIGVLDAH